MSNKQFETPGYEEEYYYINADGYVSETAWYGDAADVFRLRFGNVFLTRKMANRALVLVKSALKQIKAEQEANNDVS